MNYQKQTQSNPILPATLSGGFIRLRRAMKKNSLYQFGDLFEVGVVGGFEKLK